MQIGKKYIVLMNGGSFDIISNLQKLLRNNVNLLHNFCGKTILTLISFKIEMEIFLYDNHQLGQIGTASLTMLLFKI